MILKLFLLLFLFGKSWAFDFDPLITSKANKAKEQAEKAFEAKEYAKAIQHYKYLLDTLKIKDEKVLLNLAHAYMRNAEYEKASSAYTASTSVLDKGIKSVAYQQLGILRAEKGEREEALTQFKNALRNNPNNAEARFNYELLLKNKNKEMPKPQDQKDRKEQEKKNEEKKQQQKKDDQQKKGNEKGDKKDQKEEEKKSEDKNKGGKKEDKKGEDDLKEKEKKDDKGEEKKDDKGEEKKDDKGEGKKGDEKKNSENKEEKEKPKEGEKEENKQKQEKPDEKGEKKGEVDKPAEKGEKKDKTPSKSMVVNKDQLKQMNMTEQQAKSLLNAMRQQEVQYIQQVKKQSSKASNPGDKDW